MLSVQPISTRLRVFSRAWHGLYAFFFLFVNAQGDYFDSQNKTTFTKIIRTCENLAPAELINWQIYRLTNHLGTGLTLTTKQRKYTPIITYNMN